MLRYVGAAAPVYSLFLPLAVHIMVVSTHSVFSTGRFLCYGLTTFFGLLCLGLQFLPDLPGDIIWIPGAQCPCSWPTVDVVCGSRELSLTRAWPAAIPPANSTG